MHKIRSNANITFPWYLFSQREMTQKTLENLYSSRFKAQIRKLPKNKKRYHMVSFRRKTLFLVSFKTRDKTPGKNQIERVNLSRKNENYVTFPRVTWHLHVTVTFKRHIKRHNLPNTAGRVLNSTFKVSLLSEQPPIATHGNLADC